MLAIKLKLAGKKHQRMFRVVVAEKKSKLQGRYVDDLGFWNPHSNKFSLNEEKTNKWLKEGVRPTDTAHNLLVKAGILKGHKIAVHKKSKKAPEKISEKAPEKETSTKVLNESVKEEVVSKTVIEEAPSEIKENQE